MCLHINSEVILANVLSIKDGVSDEDIARYCEALAVTLQKANHSAYINSNRNELIRALSKYDLEFRYFQGHYFKNKEMVLAQFNARYERDVVNLFSAVARKMFDCKKD
ncbi:MAG: hypothetical protein LBC03_06410 [Nitrososphaerota archaeon]|jgi:hypothetical protein|nr:hypothetical protein [Nitrososphaerota archaeon]